jgi:hypothetical protein
MAEGGLNAGQAIALTSGLGGLTGGATSYVSAAQASKQNERDEKYREAVHAAETLQKRQQMREAQEAAQVESNKRLNEANLIRSRIRVAAGEAGIGFGGTYEALERQTDYDAETNVDLIEKNLRNQIKTIGLGGSLFQNASTPPGTAAMLGGASGFMSGANTGLSIINAAGGVK